MKTASCASLGLFIALGATPAFAQTDAAAGAAPAPAVQKVSVKGVARFDFDRANVNAEDGLKLMSEVRSSQ